MAVPIKKATSYGLEGDAPVHRIRITLTSRKVKELEKGQNSIAANTTHLVPFLPSLHTDVLLLPVRLQCATT
jgi:hypothetical protein